MKLSEVRAQYPQYDDLSDDQLVDAFHRKFYSDLPRDQVASAMGFGASEEGLAAKFGRGVRESFQQVPQLAYGLAAGGAAAAESAFGEGGLATSLKNAAVSKYNEWGDKIASTAQDTDNFSTAWEKAGSGNPGALVDWLAHGLGYVAGQGVQMVATAGVGSVAGKVAAKGVAEKVASGLVAKEAERIAAAEAAKGGVKLSAAEVAAAAAEPTVVQAATRNVAASIGQNMALAASAFGMEGGEIFGDVASQSVKEGRSLSGEELGRAFASAVGATALEYGEQALGLHALKGKLGGGSKSRLLRTGVSVGAAAPVEAGTEFFQTLLEEYGKGKDPMSPESLKQARDAAALGGLGGTMHGTIGGALSRPAPGSQNLKPSLDAQVSEVERAAAALKAGTASAGDSIHQVMSTGSVDDAIAAANAVAGHTPDVTRMTGAALAPLIDRQAELTAAVNAAGTEADQASAAAQLQTSLEQSSQTPARVDASQFADLAPMDERTARGRLKVLRDFEANAGRDALGLEIVPHPGTPGRFAIGKRKSLPSLEVATEQQVATSPAEAQNRIESAALAGQQTQAREADAGRQAVVTRALQSIEQRGGVASPAEAQIVHEAGLGKPYDRVDPSLAPALSTDQQLTQATGIALDNAPRETLTNNAAADAAAASAEQSARQAHDLAANQARSDATLKGIASAKAIGAQAQAMSAPSAPAPTAPNVYALESIFKKSPALRNAQEIAILNEARHSLTPEQMSLVERAATNPPSLSATDRLQLRQMRDATDVKESAPRETQERPKYQHSESTIVDAAALPDQKQARNGELSKQQHRFLKAIASVFGKKVEVFTSERADAPDGYVRPGDSRTIYVNARSQQAHLVVFGHELLHQIKADSPKAYNAIMSVVKLRQDANLDVPGIRGDMEEVTADLVGNLFADVSFWHDVFGKLSTKEAVRLGDVIGETVDRFKKAIGGMRGFDTGKMVENLQEIRQAATGALAEYAKSQLAENGERAQKAAENEQVSPSDKREPTAAAGRQQPAVVQGERAAPGYGTPTPGAAPAFSAWHFSTQARPVLSSQAYGTGLSGSGREKFLNATDPRSRQRIYFYVDKGQGIHPESGVGGYAHEVRLENVYDSDEDAKKLLRGNDWQAFETNVLDAGYDGYLYRAHNRSAAVVLIGPRAVKVAYRGQGQDATKPGNGVRAKDSQAVSWTAQFSGPQAEMDAKLEKLRDSSSWSGYDLRVQKGTGGFATIESRKKLPVLNIGLSTQEVAGGGQLTEAQVRQAVEATGVKITDFEVKQSNTEPTAVVTIDQPLTQEEGDRLSRQLQQEAIVQRNADGKGGDLFGPQAANWGPYNAEYFQAPSYEQGVKASEKRADPNSPQFKRWFGTGNTLVDDAGNPTILYHGTTKANAKKIGVFKRSEYGAMGSAVYLGDSPEASAGYDGGAMLKVYARGRYLDNMQWTEYVQEHGWKGAEAAARADGWSGVYDTKFENAVAVWDPSDIKSATDNSGRFDPTNPDIRASEKRVVTDVDPETGSPVFSDAKYALRMPLAVDDNSPDSLSYAIFDRETDQFVGQVTLDLVDGKPTSLAFIRMEDQRKGAGREVMHLILDAAGGKLEIRSIARDARGFWEKIGTDIAEHREGHQDEGTLTSEAFQAAIDARNGREVVSGRQATGGADDAQAARADARDVGEGGQAQERLSEKRQQLDPEVVETLGRHIRNLTPPERAKLRRDTARRLVDTLKQLPSANEMAAVAHAGRAKRGWYHNSARAVEHVFGADAPRFAGALAAMSPQTSVESNLYNTLSTWKNWVLSGRPTTREEIVEVMGHSVQGSKGRGSVLGAWVNNTVRALSSESPEAVVLSGPKVNSFALNLRGYTDEVTNDAWMASYALVDQKIFAGKLTKGGDPGKGTGYLAMSARVREAAKVLTRLTGEEWTPAEVQETVWAWAKTVYETASIDRSAEEIIFDRAITDAMIQSTPDFRTLFHDEVNEQFLRDAGLGDRVDSLRRRGDLAPASREVTGPESEAAPFDRDTQEGYEVRAARRLDELRARGNAPADEVVESEKRIFHPGDESRYTPEQRAAFERVGRTFEVPTLRERLEGLKELVRKRAIQGLFDQFAPIKGMSKEAYGLARLSRGSAGAFEALLKHGKLTLDSSGVYDADQSGGAIEKIFLPLQNESSDFLWWVAANRAERLSAEDRENLFTEEDIAAMKALTHGQLSFDYKLPSGRTTRSRAEAYAAAQDQLHAFNKNVLDMAEQSGMIDREERKLWEHEFYVPFYRVSEDGNFSGATIKDGLVRKRAFERLKGGKDKLNRDLLSNVLQNWAHLLDASSKNRAAVATLEAAVNLGAAVQAGPAVLQSMAGGGPLEKHIVWVMEDGVKKHYMVEDEALLQAISSIQYAGLRGPFWSALGTVKHWLTVGVTASPAFKVRNLIRDSISVLAVSDINANAAANFAEGVRATRKGSQSYVSALAGGGLIRFGTMLEGREADRVRRLVEMGVDKATILDSPSKLKHFANMAEKTIAAYNELGNRGEEINRMALYQQLLAKGATKAEAALMARDLMDFSSQGTFAAVRVLSQVVPFFNARLQGLYKLGTGVSENPARAAAVVGGVLMFSIGLMAAFSDDDDWKKREDWDKNGNWWFKFGGTVWRIPKPFEIGAAATLAERALEGMFFNDDMTWKRYGQNVRDIFLDNLSMNPTPQLTKPLLDLYANRDSFTGRAIETPAMQKVAPEYRYTADTSMASRGVSAVTGGTLSPVQVEHLVRGYFGWMGTTAVAAGDMIVRPMTDEPTRPARDWLKTATVGIVRDEDSEASGSSFYVNHVYKQTKELEQAYATFQRLKKEGRGPEAMEYFEANSEKIRAYKQLDRIRDREGKIAEQIRMVERSAMDPADKRERITQLRKMQDQLARRVAVS